MRAAAIVVLLPVAVLDGVGLALGRLPPSLINLPNRDYWLAPERRTETIARVRMALVEIGNATFAFFLFAVWSIIRANTTGDGRLGASYILGLFAFLVFVMVWTRVLIRPYLKVPEKA
jgi:hypothetical protein